VTDSSMKLIYEHDLQMSLDMGVPGHLYERATEFIDWYGRFSVQINGREFNMAVTPSTLIVNESDSAGPVAQLVGSEWLDTPMGRLFHADYVTSMVHGSFQIFRKKEPSPFAGFEAVEHTHMLVYTNGAGQKQFFPVVVAFTSQ